MDGHAIAADAIEHYLEGNAKVNLAEVTANIQRVIGSWQSRRA
jgi:hypothetical protein